MNTTINPLRQSVEELSKQLNLLNGLISHLYAQLGNIRQNITQRLERDNIDSSLLFSGSRLAITDLEGPEWQHFFFGPRKFMFKAQGDEYFKMVDVLIQRESAWTVAQGYESFRTFLYSIAATYLSSHHDTVAVSKLKSLTKFNERRREKGERVQPDSYPYWRDYVGFLGGPSEVLSLLRRVDNDNWLRGIERNNHRDVNLTEWLDVVSLVRHATIHSSAVIFVTKMENWPQRKSALLCRFFPGAHGEVGYTLHITVEQARTALQMFAEYAYAIFGILSRMHGYEWRMVDKKK